MNCIKLLAIIEIIILVWGFFAVGIANYMVSKEELRLQQERQNELKIHTVYKDCFCEESEG